MAGNAVTMAAAAVPSEAHVSVHTRSLTLIECMKRLLVEDTQSALAQQKAANSLQELTVHLVGADHREGNTGEETAKIFELLFQFLQQEENVHCINLVLVGPNIARPLHLLRYACEADALAVRVQYFVGSFDDYHDDKELYVRPDLAVCFNAGVWGYDEWLPTLRLLVHDLGVPLLITSYNANEASDDEDVLDDEVAPPHWFWRAEKNPFGSLTHRHTRNDFGSVLRENDHWMCVGPTPQSSVPMVS
ncbi:TPA: hypothetical protein N0F65_002027 [Lagenidium giganteum]|uniref:Mitochondrial splicing suppressor 51-like C-terminal domain-containing protein n=1 Tax=Lagenidium giganteum TaxID=4803 RepID=A0AAV2Z1W4_9STRA|nr:TPA: hypothetical protein N0F65_002027 [Lagenidium giganteum]